MKFTTASPAIIGEGGDEAELPATEVSKAHQHALLPSRARSHEPMSQADNEPSPEGQARPSGSDDEALFRPTSLQRRPTGLDDIPLVKHRDDRHNDIDTDDSTYSTSPENYKPLPRPPAQRYDQPVNQHAEEIRRKKLPRNIPSIGGDVVDSGDGHANQTGNGRNQGFVPSLNVPSPDTLASNSVTPRSSPQPPHDYQKTAYASSEFPFTASVSWTSHKQAVPLPKTRQQTTSDPSAIAESKPLSLRNVAKDIVEDSLDDFGARVRRFNDIFRLGVSAETEIMKAPFVQWIRTATWWFLKGRAALESTVRGRSPGTERTSPEPQAHPAVVLRQAYVNLAKAWWIVGEITPNHPEVRRFGKSGMSSLIAMIKNFGDQELAELVEVHLSVISSMRALTMSMKRNRILPPHELEIQRLDLHVLLRPPALSPEMANVVINNIPGKPASNEWLVAEPFFPILVGDTARHFSFGRMFVEASFQRGDATKQHVHVPCIVSLLRERNDWGVKAAITSPDGQVNLIIQPKGHGHLTWKDVHWKISSHVMQISLSDDSEMNLQFSEKDFRTLWGIYDYTRRVHKAFSPSKDEDIIFERELDKFQCDDRPKFPPDPISYCRLRLFEKRPTMSDRTNHSRAHDGYRLTVVTPPGVKTLSSVDHQFGKEHPISFSYQQSKEGLRLILKTPSSVRLSLVFHDTQDREHFRSLLCGTSIAKEDYVYGSLPLRSLAITDLSAGQRLPVRPEDDLSVKTLQWNKLRITNRGSATHGHDSLPTIRAEHLRVMVECDFATLTDRISVHPGELRMGMSVNNFNEIRLLRPPQLDMTFSTVDGKVPKEELESVCRTLQKMATSPTVRTYHFWSTSASHSFQAMVTGFKVLFDGAVSSFAISHRMSVLPIHKQREATSVRLQIVHQDKLVQLVAFFKDFSHGTCMNFVLKVTDVFETFSKSGIYYLRIADAKFALPKGEEDQTRDFVCLDMPEYPGEHDDITIGFDNEQGRSHVPHIVRCLATDSIIDRDKFGESLPAPVNTISRMASLRR